MGCGGSKAVVNQSQRILNAIEDNGNNVRFSPEGAEEGQTTRPSRSKDQSDISEKEFNWQGKMENKKDDQRVQDEEDDDNESDDYIDITKPIDRKHSREKIDTLKVIDFVIEGLQAIKEINEISMDLDDMPESYQKAKKLRQLYYNARYVVGRNFCKTFLDDLVQKGVFACIAKAMKRLQAAWPNVFLETPNPGQDFNTAVQTVALSDYDPPEGIVVQIWMKLSGTAVGTTDMHEGCRIKAGEEALIEYYLQDFLPAVSSRSYPGVKTAHGVMMQNGVSALYNCSTSSANVAYFKKFNGINKLLAIFNTPSERLNMSVLFALSYLIEEKDNHLIMANNETIDKVIDYLSHACKMKSRRYRGLSCLELANALERVAVNDENKKMIGSRKGLEALMQLFNVAKVQEQRIAAANAIWMLLFEKENQQRFMSMDGAFDAILAYKDCENKELRKAVTGIMWEVKMKDKHMEAMAETARDASGNNNNSSKHVMISYNWGQQPLMLKLRDALKEAGYNVWMDVDKIGGSTLQAMASAVENSAVILVGVSRKYKDSPNCRSEAEYAFQLRKSIVPLMLEKNYQPDGWLGFIVGAKFWIDFANQTNFKNSVQKLVKEVGGKGKYGDDIIKPVDEVDLGAIPKESKTNRTKEISKWSNSDVRDWVKQKCQLERSIKESILEKLTGKKLVSLHRLHEEAPEFFFNTLRSDFGFCDVLDLLEFWDAVKELLNE
ncbi:uncharacterized protein LOC135696802 [Rhopilema esculentum]|uniref:uncharacterized protein LOC135696802 n=1 Tax=Rhopilema esculentum TaxID=499914 RepID=UPI0031D7E365|eukprot:gene12697-3413_t